VYIYFFFIDIFYLLVFSLWRQPRRWRPNCADMGAAPARTQWDIEIVSVPRSMPSPIRLTGQGLVLCSDPI
jgi:hypothetical protein